MQQAITFSRLRRSLKRFRLAALLRIAYPYKPKKNSLIYWRAHILFTVLGTSLVLGVFAFAAAMTLVVSDGIFGLALVDIVVYGLAAYLFFSKRRRYEFRSIGTLTMGYITGLAVIFFLGPLSGGPIWLFAFAVLSGVLLGFRWALISLVLNFATLSVMNALVLSGLWEVRFPFFTSPQSMVSSLINFTVLMAVLALSVAALVHGLVFQSRKQKEAARHLKHERRQLIHAKEKLEAEIREKQVAQQMLSESEEKYRRLFELESDAIILSDNRSGEIIEANEAAVKLYGYGRNELLAMKLVDLSNEPEIMRQAIDDQPHEIPMQYQRTKGGHVFPVEMTLSHLPWEGRSANIAAIRDISFRVKAENERRHLERELFQARKMESLGTLAGGIAHDFNNILFMITGNAELLMEDIPKTDPGYVHLSAIKRAGMRAAGIVSQLLNYSRKTEISIRPLDAVHLIAEAVDFLRSTIPATIELKKKLPDHPIIIAADAAQLNQVMMNLCSNAAQAMEDNGGVLEISVEATELDESAVRRLPELAPGQYLRIMVGDTGPGMAEEVLARIFDPYFTLKEVGKGVGMGLTIVAGIVKNHNGAVAVDSQVGQGARFSLYFPIVEVIHEAAETAKGSAPEARGSLLFVDDEEVIVAMSQKGLERLGYTVTTRTNPVKALELFQADPEAFDLVVSDMTMPQMTGLVLAQKIKAVRSDIPIIICSGYSSPLDETAAGEMGIAAFVMKPIAIRDLALTISKVLDRPSV